MAGARCLGILNVFAGEIKEVQCVATVGGDETVWAGSFILDNEHDITAKRSSQMIRISS